jgi:predicted nucleic acid-binding protein
MPKSLGIDSSVLSPFARAGKLELLEQLTAGRPRMVSRAVLEEIDRGVTDYPRLADVRGCTWLELFVVDGLAELGVFSEYVRLLGAGGRHTGEAATLAWAEVHQTVALIDDDDAVQIGRARKCEIRRTLALVADSVQRTVLSVDDASRLVDDLIRIGGARFPCDGQTFIAWAEDRGLIVRG